MQQPAVVHRRRGAHRHLHQPLWHHRIEVLPVMDVPLVHLCPVIAVDLVQAPSHTGHGVPHYLFGVSIILPYHVPKPALWPEMARLAKGGRSAVPCLPLWKTLLDPLPVGLVLSEMIEVEIVARL
jgi:hypothetical protein